MHEPLMREVIETLIKHSEVELAAQVEDILDPFYCPDCGSCGEDGCCPPDKCKKVQGLYCDSNLKSYQEMVGEHEAMQEKVRTLEGMVECLSKDISALRQMGRRGCSP